MLLKNVGLKGKQKLAGRWQSDPFTIIEHPNKDIPVFKIKRGNLEKVVHRNLLLPLSFPLLVKECVKSKSCGKEKDLDFSDSISDSNVDSDENSDLYVYDNVYVAESSHLSENSRPESCSLPSEGQGLVDNSSTQGLQELLNGTDNGESNILQENEQNQSVLGNNTESQVILNGSESPSGDEQVDSDKSVVMPESEHDHSKNESSNETDSLR